jgi:microcystin-dependent protein
VSDQFIGEIRIFPFNFAPYGWAMCNGQMVQISQNSALFSLIGTYYGGNGTSNFALPNLQGRVPVDYGQAPGLSPRDIGETGGFQTVTLNPNNTPGHTHTFNAGGTRANANAPSSTVALSRSDPGFLYKQSASNPTLAALAPNVIGGSPGSNQPHDNMMPYLTLTICIALIGVYPARG